MSSVRWSNALPKMGHAIKMFRNKRVLRFIIVAISVPLLILGNLWLQAALNFGDSDLPPYQADTPFESACAISLAILGLPLLPVIFLSSAFGFDLPDFASYLLLAIPGVFWASLVEFLVMARTRLLFLRKTSEADRFAITLASGQTPRDPM
jgi:hypothetical protein